MNGMIEPMTNGSDNDRVRLRYRFGEKEIELEGKLQDVKEIAIMWFSQMSRGVEALPDTSRVSPETQARWVNSETPPNTDVSSTEPVKMAPNDLINFFREKSPNGQKEEVAAITYFYKSNLGRESITIEDYEEAYKALKRLAVPTPNNMKSSVRNVVDRTDLLFNPERGQFALTLQGEQFVEEMPKHDDPKS